MIDLIKKAMFTGIGFAVLTKEKVEDLAQEFVEQGKMTREEGEKLIDDILKKSRESQEEMSRRVEGLVHEGLARLDLVQREELVTLREELAALKERIARLEEKGDGSR